MASVRRMAARRDPLRQVQAGRPSPIATRKPSVIFVLLDDIGIEYLDYHGLGEQYAGGTMLRESPDPGIEWSYFTTPRISALAHRGVWFDNFFATPLCSTSRTRLHTGLRSDQIALGTNLRDPSQVATANFPTTGFALDSSFLFMAEHLRAQDSAIATAHFGKWHMADAWSTVGDGLADHTPNTNLTDPARFGFQTSSWGPLPYGGRYAWWNIVDGTPTWIDGEVDSTFDETTHAGSVMANAACDWIAARTGPFMCSVSLEYTHMPLDVPPFTLLSSETQAALTDLGLEAGDRLVGLPNFEDPRVDDDFWPQLYANAEAMDTMVGRIEDSIPQALRARTYIVIMGDNGGHIALTPEGFPLHGKDSLTRGGTNVTCVVVGPRVAHPDQAIKNVCDIGDVYATIAELMGHPTTGTSGVSMVPALVNTIDRSDVNGLKANSIQQSFFPVGEDDSDLFTAWRRTIVDGRFRYIDNAGTQMFYDLRSDPLEATDIVNSMTTEQNNAFRDLQAALELVLPST